MLGLLAKSKCQNLLRKGEKTEKKGFSEWYQKYTPNISICTMYTKRI